MIATFPGDFWKGKSKNMTHAGKLQSYQIWMMGKQAVLSMPLY